MKAVVFTEYGSPDVLSIQTMPRPVPTDSEILIRIHTACVGPADCAFRKGEPFIVRLIYGLRRPKKPLQGAEFAGTVEAVGQAVDTFQVGDRVFGLSPNTFGAHAEYMRLPASGTVATIPDQMSFAEAVGICDGGLTALTFLRDEAGLQPQQQVLINGASGAVGAYAVQLAKHFDTHVTAVCSGVNTAMVEALGADTVIDYTQEDFTQNGKTYDVIFDAVGKRSFAQCKGSLTPQGIYLTTVPTVRIVLDMLWTKLIGGKRAKFTAAGLRQNKENLGYLSELYNKGALKAVIDREYSLEDIVEAHRYVETGRKKGNVLITVQ